MPSIQEREFVVGLCLGRGGFGEVYRAVLHARSGLQRDVVLKVLRDDLDPRSQAAARLHDEGRILSRLNHPVLLGVIDVVTLQGRVALVAEFVDGQDLGDVLAELSPRSLVEVIGQLADALNAAWSHDTREGTPMRLVHRDVKPSNVRMGRHGEIKLLDFGIARADVSGRAAHTQTDFLVGSPPYMAPERFTSAESEPSSDVYALGAVLAEGLTGRRLVGGMPVPMIVGLALDREAHQAHITDRLSHTRPDIPESVVALARSCLLWAPQDRPSAAELANRCEAMLDSVPGVRVGRWARDRVWPEPMLARGALTDLTLSEGQPPGTQPPPRTRMAAPWAVAGLGLLALVSAVAAVATIAVVGVLWTGAPPSAELPTAVNTPRLDADPPRPVIPVASLPEATPEPVAASDAPRSAAPRARPSPVPVETTPVAIAEAVPTLSSVTVPEGLTAFLIQGTTKIALPSDAVPPGDYTIEAAFPAGTPLQRKRQVTIGAGRWAVKCAMRDCAVEPGA